jgi:hypothetical protein
MHAPAPRPVMSQVMAAVALQAPGSATAARVGEDRAQPGDGAGEGVLGRGGVAEDERGLMGLPAEAVRAQAFDGESALRGAGYGFVLGVAFG